jgi:hypothetical protein
VIGQGQVGLRVLGCVHDHVRDEETTLLADLLDKLQAGSA